MTSLDLFARPLWFCACIALALTGLSLSAIAYFIAFHTESQPIRNLGGDDRARIVAASSFVDSHRKKVGQLPTDEDFSLWAKAAPGELRYEGVGFRYQRNADSTYTFDWYGGRGIMLWWKSDSATYFANISKDSYFLFGSKWADLSVFFGFAVLAFWSARRSVAEAKKG